MAAFTARDPRDKGAFLTHWETILSDTKVKMKTIVSKENGEVLGHVASYVDCEFGKREVTYWIGKEYWGKGIATRALSEFLKWEETVRPIYARVVSDNLGSFRVLEKCGFKVSGKAKSYAEGRKQEVEELIMELKPETRRETESRIAMN
jgi:RimJ/RimL family protein N-acetyltransferase